MPRRDDVIVAFRAAVQRNPKGYMCLHTQDFIRVLREYNHHFTEQDANRWIMLYQPEFIDRTPDHSENRLWMLRGMGRIR